MTGVCVECGRPFVVRRRGFDPVVCSEPCREQRRRHQADERRRRWLERQIAAARATEAT